MSASKPKESQRIAKLLARAGIASRREIERMIAEGRIALDGKLLETPATLLTSLRGVTVDGKPVAAAAPAQLFIFHKPTGVLTTERDPKGRRTIYDLLPKDLPRLVPVGRLDLNTEGLLLMTTDGELKRQLELPATGVERTYRARAFGPVTQAQLEELIDGVEIEGVRYGPIDANLERRTGANTWIELTLTEGKNREVRRVLEHLGLEVSRLLRVRYGPFVLGDLPPGGIGEVLQHDLVAFRKTLKLPADKRRYDPVTAAPAKPKPSPRSAPAEPPRPVRGGARPGAHPRPGNAVPAGKPARAERARNFREERGDRAAGPAKAPTPAKPQRARTGREERGDRPGSGAKSAPATPQRARNAREGRGDRSGSGAQTPAPAKPQRPRQPGARTGRAAAPPRGRPGRK